MEISKLLAVFIQGVAIGSGPCLIICAPIVLPFVAGTQRTFYEGLRSIILFSFGRVLVYTILGGLFGYFGYWLSKIMTEPLLVSAAWIAVSVFIIFLGGMMALGRDYGAGFCRLYSGKSLFLLGILVGVSPCLPLLAILTEIALFSRLVWAGAVYGLTFGLGTMLSPLLIFGALLPLIPKYLLRKDQALIICGLLLMLIGIYLFFARLFPTNAFYRY